MIDKDATISNLVQLSPPVVVSSVTILGVSLHDWVYVATIIYTIVGIATLIKKHWWNTDNETEDDSRRLNGRASRTNADPNEGRLRR